MSIHPKIRRVASCAHLWRTPAGSFPLPILVQILLELAQLALVIQLVPDEGKKKKKVSPAELKNRVGVFSLRRFVLFFLSKTRHTTGEISIPAPVTAVSLCLSRDQTLGEWDGDEDTPVRKSLQDITSREVLEAFSYRSIFVCIPFFTCLIAIEAQRDSSNGWRFADFPSRVPLREKTKRNGEARKLLHDFSTPRERPFFFFFPRLTYSHPACGH